VLIVTGSVAHEDSDLTPPGDDSQDVETSLIFISALIYDYKYCFLQLD
jgi:hypothetical protein